MVSQRKLANFTRKIDAQGGKVTPWQSFWCPKLTSKYLENKLTDYSKKVETLKKEKEKAESLANAAEANLTIAQQALESAKKQPDIMQVRPEITENQAGKGERKAGMVLYFSFPDTEDGKWRDKNSSPKIIDTASLFKFMLTSPTCAKVYFLDDDPSANKMIIPEIEFSLKSVAYVQNARSVDSEWAKSIKTITPGVAWLDRENGSWRMDKADKVIAEYVL
ncbi:MAG: hypothetical protein WC861_03045 [Candidatus Micrarchaeia archaeon]|jgi:hypothetical protein